MSVQRAVARAARDFTMLDEDAAVIDNGFGKAQAFYKGGGRPAYSGGSSSGERENLVAASPATIERRPTSGSSQSPPQKKMHIPLPKSPIISFCAALAYGFTSLSMGFINKGVLMEFPHANFLLTLQMVTTAALVYLGGKSRLIHVRPFELKTARRLVWLAFFYNGNVAFALASLQGLNIPMYIALKRLTPMIILIVSYLRGKKSPMQVTLAVLLTVIGCVIAAWGDLDFNMRSYAMGLMSVFLQSGYLIMVETGGEEGLNSSELMLYNSVLSFPVLTVMVIVTGEAGVAVPALFKTVSTSPGLFAAILVSLLMAILLNFTMFLCTITNSALTTTIVGVLKGVGSTTLGFFLLGGVKVHSVNIIGLVMNTTGGVWYSIAKYRMKASRRSQRSDQNEPLLPKTHSTPSRPKDGQV